MNKNIKKPYIYAVGRRKTAIARVRLTKKGENKITINGINIDKYFTTVNLQNMLNKPLRIAALLEKVDISIKAVSGGKYGQAAACSLAIARALVLLDKELKIKLKKSDLLKRDSRKKERKKPGLRRARRAPQWSKR